MTVRIICDFDGTIAEKDMIAAIMRRFAPKAAEPIIQRVQSGQEPIQSGVEQMFQLIPSTMYDEVVRFARENTVIREGFQQFIHTCGQLGWQVSVVSGGFDFFVHPVIHSLSTPVDIYCNRIDKTGENLRVVWGVTCDPTCEGGCGLCKPSVMRQLEQQGDENTKFVVIGDGVTDFKAAKLADYVFARSSLLKLVEQHNTPFAPFETFIDIDNEIRNQEAAIYEYI